ncbi:MAG: transporter substrate-binding domain-containing protein [bacterium]|nr:transporter substrate-binding domain-containing protein [bacterium]
MIKRTHISLLLALVLFASCSQQGSGSRDNNATTTPEQTDPITLDFDAIKKRGYITAIVDNSSTGMFVYKGRPMGYDYELLSRFAKEHDLELRIDVTTDIDLAFKKLDDGRGDILAYNLTVTKERKQIIRFTDYHYLVRLVLVQRKPSNWRDMKVHEIEKTLIRNPVELIGKEVYVRNSTSHVPRLENLSEEIGGDILIIEDFPDVETETLIRKVALKEIDYTVAEEDVAMVNKTYYPILDVKTPISFPQQIAWGVRLNAPSLQDTLNAWISSMKKSADYYVLYNKYYRNQKASLQRKKSDYFSMGGDKISPYDEMIKEAADVIGWDWQLLAAQMFKESNFDPKAKSWAGAIGLMQLMPATAKQYGVQKLTDPEQSIRGGMKHLIWLEKLWDEIIWDETERKKFILASYNIGQGHVMDAYKLAQKHGGDASKWEVVSEYLLKKSDSKYYNDPVVEFGYCRGIEPVDYVQTIFDIYQTYQELYPIEQDTTTASLAVNQPPI